MIEEKGEFVVLRHENSGYSIAIGCPPDTKWEYHVVGRYESRAEAEAAIMADRKANAAKAK